MTKKTVYLRPGDMIEVRFVDPAIDECNFKGWDRQARRPKMLLRVWNSRVAPATPDIQFDTSNQAWKE